MNPLSTGIEDKKVTKHLLGTCDMQKIEAIDTLNNEATFKQPEGVIPGSVASPQPSRQTYDAWDSVTLEPNDVPVGWRNAAREFLDIPACNLTAYYGLVNVRPVLCGDF